MRIGAPLRVAPQRTVCAHALPIVQRPSVTTCPRRSADAMNSLGAIVPSSGCSQRKIASTAAIEPSPRSTIGW